MSSYQRSPKSTLTGHKSPVDSLQQVSEDVDMQRALLTGNAAMQEEAGTGAGPAEGGFGDVLEWGWEQIGSAEAFAQYLAAAGEAAAKAMADVLIDKAPDVLIAYLNQLEALNAFTFWLAERLGELDLTVLDPVRQALWFAGYIQYGVAVVLRALLALSPEQLLAAAREAGEAAIEAALQLPGELGLRLLDATWAPGLGVAVRAEAGGLVTFGGDMKGTVTLRHVGRGVFTVEVEAEVAGKAELGLGVKGGTEGAEATIGVRGYGGVAAELEFPDVLTAATSSLALAVLSGVTPFVEAVTGFDLGTRYLTKLTVGAGVEGEGSLDADLPEMKLLGALGVSTEVTMEVSELEWDLPFVIGATVTYTGTREDQVEVAAKFPIFQSLFGELEDDAGTSQSIQLTAHVAWDGWTPTLSDPALEVFGAVDTGSAEVEAGVGLEGAGDDVASVLDAIGYLRFKAEVPCDAAAAAMLASSPLMALFEAERLKGSLSVEAKLTADDARAMAELVLDARKKAGSKDLAKDLLAWVHDPVGALPASLTSVFCLELACSSSLTAEISAEIDLTGELEFAVAELAKLGIEAMVGVNFSYEKDILEIGGKVGAADIQAMLAGPDVDAAAA